MRFERIAVRLGIEQPTRRDLEARSSPGRASGVEDVETFANIMSQRANPCDCVHRIDSDGRISFVNDAWLVFAEQNGWPVTAAQVIGSPLMQQIADLETRHIYQLLIDSIRGGGRQARFLYRCDSPDRRRLMEMRVSGRAPGQVEFRSRVLRLEPREPVALLDPRHQNRSSDILTVCSWCKAVLAEQTWVEVEQAVRRLAILTERALPRISHGICPGCSERMKTAGEHR
ncbi:MAG: PAS domain-containing protein [Thiocapsa sp.]|nr:PAS domain-containing protein [Thiocapsa sp.]